MAKGKPVETAIACNAPSPPPIKSAAATSPSNVAQKTRCATGASTLPPAVIVSITSDPESDEVTKNTMTSTMDSSEAMKVSGICVSISKSFSSSAASWAPVKPSTISWSSAAPPRTVIQTMETAVGISSTQVMNSRTVRPRLTRAMNMPTNGDQLIHQAQ